jgi:hypothetical protein
MLLRIVLEVGGQDAEDLLDGDVLLSGHLEEFLPKSTYLERRYLITKSVILVEIVYF